jgi:hypothetical protein
MYTAVGILGALLILFGFYRTSIGKWTGTSLWYELDNLVGAVMVAVYQVHYHAYISVGVNIVWAAVALRGLTSLRQRRRDKN